ncbi:helix-turn-helix domain-containing protein [Nocardia caishijiensis]|uniref:HTH cro/C1-type domain-containing protein n=1 Tax=Nocardia caishijiensis TaxID=184756 RepID=A0ABQ6YTQ5_9NOCA|nr:helix-turn-helix domain-containing protein [Nocardia caishijiensis]KAF0849192.1 hypothetical protein FNL39_101629 [Nocardia caishijiensis]
MPVGRAQYLGAKVHERRRQLNLTINDVKRAGGPTGPTVVKAEAGQLDEPRPSTLAKFDQALRWTAGSAARIFWDGEEPTPVREPALPVLDPGSAEVALPVEAMLQLLGTQRRLADYVDRLDAESSELAAISLNLDEQISAIVGSFVTDLLERNHGRGELDGIHPLLEFAFGDLLGGKGDGAGESEEQLYRRWLAGKRPHLPPDLVRRFQARLDDTRTTRTDHE